MDDLKREAQDDAAYWEHQAVAAAWKTPSAPLVLAVARPGTRHQTANEATKTTTRTGNSASEAQEALRGLEEQTTEGHWQAYKARRDTVNAVLDAQEAQLRRGGWIRRDPKSSCVLEPQSLATVSAELSQWTTQEARQRGVWDAAQVGYA